ncbi:MAG TPA: hypothetical protein PKK26_14520 [Candidatus Wallbacteria bacterium]|nr:hypothetical protein [Candidatus Wallbacteria bacterium]
MGSYKLDKFIGFITGSIANIESAIKEVNEMQEAFTSEYVNKFQISFDAETGRITDYVVKAYINGKYQNSSKFYVELTKCVDEKKKDLAEKKTALEKELKVNEKRLDTIKNLRKNLMDDYKIANPEMDAAEEAQKVVISRHEGAILTLGKTVATLCSGMGFITNYWTVSAMKKNLATEIEKLKQEKLKLKLIRAKFVETKTDKEKKETNLEADFREAINKIGYLKQAYERVAGDAELTAVIEAAENLLKTGAPEILKELAGEFPDISKYIVERVKTADYEKSLKTVAEEIGFLNGIKSGFENILKTATSLNEQYKQYSSYLCPLTIVLPEECEEFKESFKQMALKVVDDRALGKEPAEYLKIVEPFHKKFINEPTVKRCFEAIGSAIDASAKAWK